MKKILLINPPYYEDIFITSKVQPAVTRGIIVLGLSAIAAPLRENGHSVKILDLNIELHPQEKLKTELLNYKPDFIGITFTTPLFDTIVRFTKQIKLLLPKTIVVLGGPHATALPIETLKNTGSDYVVIGEGDYTFLSLVKEVELSKINGIAYRDKNGDILLNPKTNFIQNLDSLPYPALDLYEIKKYKYPRITSRQNPVGSIETSRGCFAHCVFCNKNIFGYKFRYKNPKRVVDEMEYVLSLGFKEIHIVDDGFTTIIERSEEICNEIIKRKMKFPWYVRGGVRVDRVTLKLLGMMKRAGCYRIPFGIESGDKEVLHNIKKGITLTQSVNAVNWAKKVGMIVDGYFMLGLPGDTKDSIARTIEFACKLNIDFAKFAISVPLPGTELYNELVNSGKLKTNDWNKFNFSTPMKDVYEHNLDWDFIENQYNAAYKKFYFRPKYIWKKLIEGLIRGELLGYIEAFLKMKL